MQNFDFAACFPSSDHLLHHAVAQISVKRYWKLPRSALDDSYFTISSSSNFET